MIRQFFIRKFKPTPFLIILTLAFGLSGCGSDDPKPGSITIFLDHAVSGVPLALNSGQYINAAGNQYSITRLEYILTDFALVSTDGDVVQMRANHYRDAADNTTRTFLSSNIPGGRYTELRFNFGIPAASNQTGALPNTTAYNNMAWPTQMGGGYHYMRLEGLHDGSSSFLVHMGPTMGNDYSFRVPLGLDVGLNGDDVAIQVFMNIERWFTTPNTYDFQNYPGMIMDNAGAQTVLKANGTDVFTIGAITGN
ncbi:MAG: hypothetical protein O2954_06115 [bacterium]|nr:hypothetical protein [bacterium]